MSDQVRRVVKFLGNRWVIKTGFFVFFLYCIAQLLRFEQYMLNRGPEVTRPEAVAGILPVGHFTSFFAWLKGGGWDTLLPAGLVIIIAAITVSLLFKRGFCGYICPVGTLWSYGGLLGRVLFGKNYRLPKVLDYFLRGFQVLIAAGALWLLSRVSLEEAVWFRKLPYMWIADLKIIHEFATAPFMIAILVAFAISIFLSPLWCRYLCPLGGLYGTLGVFSASKVTRNTETCIDCGKCAQACPTFIDPSKVKSVSSSVCDGCMDCVNACPVKDCLQPKLFGLIVIKPWMWGLLVVAVWLAIYGIAVALGQWHSTLTVDEFRMGLGALYSKTQGFF